MPWFKQALLLMASLSLLSIGISSGAQTPPSDERGSEQAKLYYQMALSSVNEKQYEQARQYLSLVINLDPTNIQAYYQRGLVWIELGILSCAYDDFTAVLHLDPDNYDAYYQRGSIQLGYGQYKSAIWDFNRAINIDDKRPEAYCGRGEARAAYGKPKLALQDFSQVIALTPGYYPAYLGRAEVYRQMEDYPSAENDLILVRDNCADGELVAKALEMLVECQTAN
jgi:tetratricopeptide (TPR) repeat protein